ncbi:MAG: hypothetical protein E3J72_12690 [Planctomycetota bacterium]|nr:MAG: hypothetical protein E3J72_12690 [Planctomycetota bacterium]
MKLIKIILLCIPIAAVLGCSTTGKDAESSAPKRLDKTRPYVLTFNYPDFPRIPGMKLTLWIYDFQTAQWKPFHFINKCAEKWLKFHEWGTITVDFGALGYGDGTYGILIKMKGYPAPTTPQIVKRKILIDTVPPEVRARFQKDKPVYSAGETVLIDIEILERKPKADSLAVEMRGTTSTEWKPVLKDLDPATKTIELPAPETSEEVNFLRISVQDEAENTGSVVIGPFTVRGRK